MANRNANAVAISGHTELLKLLKEVGTPDEAIKEANLEIGNLVVNTAKATAQFKYTSAAYRKKTKGRLLKTVRASGAGGRATIMAGMKSVPYAGPIHWGWFYDKNWFIQKNIEPNPFLANALGYKRDEIIATYSRNIEKLIAKWYPKN
jgi:hypothetical protein